MEQTSVTIPYDLSDFCISFFFSRILIEIAQLFLDKHIFASLNLRTLHSSKHRKFAKIEKQFSLVNSLMTAQFMENTHTKKKKKKKKSTSKPWCMSLREYKSS